MSTLRITLIGGPTALEPGVATIIEPPRQA
jgi:hypothetical protein